MNNMIIKMNEGVANSFVGRYFQFKERDARFSKEFQGATTTFLAMAYILAVNPRILADSGGSCVPPEGGSIFSPEYEDCLLEIRKQYVTATAVASLFGCFLMGFIANLPIALSCGMGMNAYFTYSVVGWRGTGSVSYQSAVTAVLIEGFIFALLSVTGIRFIIVKLIPEPVRVATPAGIGAFLAHLGLQTAEGIGVVVSDIATAVTLGGCTPEKRTPMIAYDDLCIADANNYVTSDAYTCDVNGGIMRSPTTWLGVGGLIITAAMLSYRKKTAFIVGIAFVTIISWFRNTAVTYFPDTSEGDAKFAYFSQVVSVEPLNLIFAKYSGLGPEVIEALFTFLFVDFLDTSGTLFALVTQLGYMEENGDFPKSRWAFTADAISTSFGSLFGLSPVTSYIESAAGVEAGAKTGLTAIIVGLYFFISIFFAPIIASIPAWATGGTLIIVGALMCQNLVNVKWWDPAHAISAFLTVMIMPLTYSIANGLIAGMMVWFALQLIFFVLSLIGVSRPKLTQEESKVGQDEMENMAKEVDAVEVQAKSVKSEGADNA